VHVLALKIHILLQLLNISDVVASNFTCSLKYNARILEFMAMEVSLTFEIGSNFTQMAHKCKECYCRHIIIRFKISPE
jgi:hypothetical protein